MKKLRENIDRWLDKFEDRWHGLPLRKQHRCLLYIFSGYFILSVVVVTKVCMDAGRHEKGMAIEHIDNPVLKKEKPKVLSKDSLFIILKNKAHGK